jgi:pilus assembly protein CpaC
MKMMNNPNKNITSLMRILNKFLLTLSLILVSSTCIASERIYVFMGEIKILEVGAIDRVAVGNSKLLSTSMLDNGQLLLLAEGIGETTVHIWYKDGSESNLEVGIIPNDAKRIMNEIQTLVDNVGDIEVKKVGERIYLIGTVYKSALTELDLIKGAYKEVIDLTKKLDDPIAPTVIPDDKMIFMNVKFAELRGGLNKNLGVAWDQIIAGPVAALNYDVESNSNFRAADPNRAPAFVAGLPAVNAGPLGFLGLATQINSAINLLVASSNAVILAEPTLSARSGGKAEFLAGGEIPVVTSGSLGSTDVEYKEFGIKLEVEPVVGFDNTIVAKITTESSSIDPDRPGGGDTPPGFITRRTSTDIRMNDNETLIMSGLVDRKLSENVTKMPFLGDLPVIGSLFRNTLTDNDDNDLVIFVTPTVFDANSDINKNEIAKRQQMIDTFKKNTEQEDLIID